MNVGHDLVEYCSMGGLDGGWEPVNVIRGLEAEGEVGFPLWEAQVARIG